MSQTPERTEIAPCPNPKCGKPIWSDHDDSWCHKCGESFPQELAAKLPLLMAYRSAGSQSTESAQPSKIMESATPRARVVMGRYRDAYRTANVIVTAGNTIKAVGLVIAAIIAVIDIVTSSKIGMPSLLAGLIPASVVGFLSWLSGVLLNAQGQLLLASLDGVVSISLFLTDEEKAEVMALP